jgi:hypothetical protein
MNRSRYLVGIIAGALVTSLALHTVSSVHAQSAAPTYPSAPAVAVSKTAGATATLKWGAVTNNTDGSAVAGTIYYNVHESDGPAGAAFSTLSATSNTTFTTAVLAAGTPCWYVTAVEGGTLNASTNTVSGGVESGPSSIECAQVVPPVPNAPAALTVQ